MERTVQKNAGLFVILALLLPVSARAGNFADEAISEHRQVWQFRTPAERLSFVRVRELEVLTEHLDESRDIAKEAARRSIGIRVDGDLDMNTNALAAGSVSFTSVRGDGNEVTTTQINRDASQTAGVVRQIGGGSVESCEHATCVSAPADQHEKEDK